MPSVGRSRSSTSTSTSTRPGGSLPNDFVADPQGTVTGPSIPAAPVDPPSILVLSDDDEDMHATMGQSAVVETPAIAIISDDEEFMSAADGIGEDRVAGHGDTIIVSSDGVVSTKADDVPAQVLTRTGDTSDAKIMNNVEAEGDGTHTPRSEEPGAELVLAIDRLTLSEYHMV